MTPLRNPKLSRTQQVETRNSVLPVLFEQTLVRREVRVHAVADGPSRGLLPPKTIFRRRQRLVRAPEHVDHDTRNSGSPQMM